MCFLYFQFNDFKSKKFLVYIQVDRSQRKLGTSAMLFCLYFYHKRVTQGTRKQHILWQSVDSARQKVPSMSFLRNFVH
jgi:hypothetical protein